MDPGEHTIVDCHIHPAADEEHDACWFLSSGSFQQQIDTLKRCGIARACGAPVRRMDPDSFSEITAINDLALSLRDRAPDFYTPGIQVHPRFPDESCREIERRCGGEGVRWIGELVGYMMGYGQEYTSEGALAVMRTAQNFGAVVSFHCGSADVVGDLCSAVPGLPLVLAHPGDGRDNIRERLELVSRYPNLHLDISGSGIDRFGVLRTAVDVAGAEKLLFGTDFPINNPAVYVYGALLEPLTGPERDALFAGNFTRLVGVSS